MSLPPLRTRLPAFLAALVLVFPGARPAAAVDPVAAAASEEITVAGAVSAEKFLAGPKCLGRRSGSPGGAEAARWLAAELRKAGFAPGVTPDRVEDGKTVEGDYLQPYDLPPPRGAAPGSASAGKTFNVVGVLPGAGRAPVTGTVTPGSAPAAPGGAGGAPAPAPAPGTPPVEEEWVVLGAHYDHLGVRNPNPKSKKPPKKTGVFWGADDNASGTTAALLVARALGRLARNGAVPRRGVIVVFFSGEELGLLGSRHYCSSPVRPLAATAAMINLDMVGRNALKYLEVYGNTSSPELEEAHRAVLAETKFECVYPGGDVFTRSDHYSFYEKDIPVIFFHGGLHKDYHQTGDTPDLIVYPKVAAVARHALGVLWRAANMDARPTFRKVDMTGAGGKLGLAVDPCNPEDEDALDLKEGASAVLVRTVFSGGLGEKAGFKAGDLVYLWNGFSLFDDDPVSRFNGFVNAARTGDQVVIRWVRGGQKMSATVKF